MFFSPVCFLPWRAAWPEVVKVSVHLKRAACGQGYFFLAVGVLVADVALLDVVIGVVGSVLMLAEVGVADIGGSDAVVVVVVAEDGV